MDVGVEAARLPPDRLRRLLLRHAPHAAGPAPHEPCGAGAWTALRAWTTPDAAALAASGSGDAAPREFARLLDLATRFTGGAGDADPVTSPFALGFATKWLALALAAACGPAEPPPHASAGAGSSATTVRAPRSRDLAVLGHAVECAEDDGAALLTAGLGGDAIGGEAFALADLLRALPEMDAALRACGVAPTSAHRVVPEAGPGAAAPGATLRVGVPGLAPADVARLPIAPVLQARGAWTSLEGGRTAVSWIAPCAADRELATLFARADDAWYAEGRVRDRHVPRLAIYALLLEALTSIARDSHRAWRALRFEHPAEAELVRAFLRLAATRVPELALDELRRRSAAGASMPTPSVRPTTSPRLAARA